MEKNILKIFKIIALIIILIGVVSVAFIWVSGDTAIIDSLSLQNRILNPYFFAAYAALAICCVLALLFPILNLIANPKRLVKALIAIGALLVFGFLVYSLSTNQLSAIQLQEYNISETQSRQIGAALYGTYAIGFLSIVTIVYAEISSAFKK